MNNCPEGALATSGHIGVCADSVTTMPKLHVKKIELRLPADRRDTSIKMAKDLSRELREKTVMVVALWPLQAQTTRQLEAEVTRLQQHLQELEVAAMEIKRKRWCRVCQEEATYMNWPRVYFYCSKRCERKHKRIKVMRLAESEDAENAAKSKKKVVSAC